MDGSLITAVTVQDTVTVAGMTVKGQTLGMASSYSSTLRSLPADGFLGLA